MSILTALNNDEDCGLGDGLQLWSEIPITEEDADALQRSLSPTSFTSLKHATIPTPPPEKIMDSSPKDDACVRNGQAKRKIEFDLVDPVGQLSVIAKAIQEDRKGLAQRCDELNKEVATLKKELEREIKNRKTLETEIRDTIRILGDA